MAAAPIALAAVGTILQTKGMLDARKAAKQKGEAASAYGSSQRTRAEFEATQLEQQAGQAVAVGQRENLEVQRLAKLTESRALALAAASGGGASAPTVVNLIGDIAKRGAYHGAVALYNGEEKARQLTLAAASKRYEGQIAEEAGQAGELVAASESKAYGMGAGAALLSGAGSLYEKYSRGGPANVAQVPESVPGQYSLVNPSYG